MIRMMANFLGVSTFNKGIANYLHANSLSNANQDDLWSFLTAAGQVLFTPCFSIRVVIWILPSYALFVTSCFFSSIPNPILSNHILSNPPFKCCAGRWNIGGENSEGGDGHLDGPDGLSSHQHRQV